MNAYLETNGKMFLNNLFVKIKKGKNREPDRLTLVVPVHATLRFKDDDTNKIVFADGATKRIKVNGGNDFQTGLFFKTISCVIVGD